MKAAARTGLLSEGVVRELAAFKSDGASVTTCYLDVDGRRYVRPHDYEVELERMLRPVREREHRSGNRSVFADLKRIEDHVKGGVDRSHTRGLALFSCAAADFWRALDLPVAVRNRVVVNQSPQVRQLEAIVERAERFAVLLADRQRARLFVFRLGELVELSERFDSLPRHEDEGAEVDRDQRRDHLDSATNHHLRRTAETAFAAFRERPFDHLAIGAPTEIAGALERRLHPYLRERVVSQVGVAVNGREDEVRDAITAVEAEVEERKEAAAVARLRQAAASGTGGVTGLQDVLTALVERRAETVLVSDGFEAPGWRCGSCGWLGTRGPTCPVDGAAMDQAEDVVEELVHEALNQSCRLEVCHGNADLDVLGRIGALLRF